MINNKTVLNYCGIRGIKHEGITFVCFMFIIYYYYACIHCLICFTYGYLNEHVLLKYFNIHLFIFYYL